MSDALSIIHTQATQSATSSKVASVVGFLPPDFIANTLVPLETVSAPTDTVNAAAIESTTSVDLTDLNVDTNDYLAAVQAGDVATAEAQSHLLTQVGKNLVSDLASFTSTSNGSYVYTANTTSGWARLDANNNPTPANGPPPSGQTGYVGSAPSGAQVAAAPNGTINLSGGVGNLIASQGPWTFQGTAQLDGLEVDLGSVTVGSGSSISAGNLNLPGTGTITVDGTLKVTGNVASSALNSAIALQGSGAMAEFDGGLTNVTLNFTGANQTVLIKEPAGAGAPNLRVTGFVATDKIDFVGQNDLTMSNPDTGPLKNLQSGNAVYLWSGSLQPKEAPAQKAATIQFDQVPQELEPQLDGNGGTQLIVGNSQPAKDPTTPANSIQWDFVRNVGEGGTLGYPICAATRSQRCHRWRRR